MRGAQWIYDSAKELKATWEAYGLRNEFLIAVVSDTASVMGAFGRLLAEEEGVFHVYCTAHVLELITGMAFDVSGAGECMKVIKYSLLVFCFFAFM